MKNYLFLVLSSCFMLGLMKWTGFSFDLQTPLYYKISWKAEYLLSSTVVITSLLLILGAVIGFNLHLSEKIRKYIAFVGLSGIMFFFFSWQAMLSFLFVAVLLYIALGFFQKDNKKFLALVVLALFVLMIVFSQIAMNRYSFFLLFGQLLFGYYSTVVDKCRGLSKTDPIHAWILWFCFPAGLFTILYGYKTFSESFNKSAYSETASRGAYLIGLALFQLITIQLIEIYYFPEYSFLRSKVVTVANANDSTLDLWIHGAKIFFFFFFEQVGTINLVQGITKIFGYDVDRQIDGLWRATSFLDVWKRGSYNTRMYWINYFYMPILLKTKNIYLSDLSVWFIYGVIASMAYGGINFFYVKPDSISEIWFTIFLKHFVMYGAASCLEMYLNTNILSNRNVSIFNKYVVRAFLFVSMYVIYIIGNEFGPNPNSTLTETLKTIGQMVGIL